MKKIPFNKPYLSGKELFYISQTVHNLATAGNSAFTKKCHHFFQQQYGFHKVLLTTSCTDALEMATLLLNIQAGDEIIMPSYTFVSTANAFVLRGAKIVFVDSTAEHPNIDAKQIAPLITPHTKAIVVVHYAGMACDMDAILTLAQQHNLYVVEDAAQAIDSFYKGRPLGGFGHLAAFSFHETKNIISGEGGMLVINDARFAERAEIIWEKGTNRSAFYRGEIDKYGWVDVGSSFLPSDIIAAFLYAQLENLADIQKRRKAIWQSYFEQLHVLEEKGYCNLPHIPENATNNGHIFYLTCKTPSERSQLITHLKSKNMQAVFHYLSLHQSQFYAPKHDGRVLPNCEHFADCLIRLPLFYELTTGQIRLVCEEIKNFYAR